MSQSARTARALLGLACAAFMAALAPELTAQAPRGPLLQVQSGPGWRPTLGARVGLDYRNQVPSIGAFLRLPIPGVPAALSGGGDLVFHDGLTERQGTVDVTANLGGLYLGGGPVALNSIFVATGERETKVGYAFLVGVRGGLGRFGTNLELRWVRVDELNPRFMMLAFTWTPGAPARRRSF